VLKKIEELLADDTAGDPMSDIKWTRKSTYAISEELCSINISISPKTAGKLLKDLDYSLKANRKTIAETHHPDRNRQFEIIADMKKKFTDMAQPVVSVDSKKKEMIGNFKNNGTTWTKEAEKVFNHDFRSMAVGIANPYGIYDLIANSGTVVVGTSYNTPEFAAESIELWLTSYAWSQYPHMEELLILCDSGGSNSYRARLWKYTIHNKICRLHGISITVCHYPPGASKWNPADHRLFSFISMNWSGVPLRSYDIMLNYIRNTTTRKGLKVDAILNDKKYEKGLNISEDQMNTINLKRHAHLPDWNYTIKP
jgi:hypothetical protein